MLLEINIIDAVESSEKTNWNIKVKLEILKYFSEYY